ncbi:DUF5134 domain-containing protein [Streptomyces sp. NBC_01387]|uniref:DUF5134 domain-containing protein n=1 Tax=unclassified Streptomyces TaxID=2593676 RepID=UPI002DD95E0C|nr:DUF5134 domain-containing protein [Streptomyces sp. NBC_01766]WSC23931.1 DUF5134 domain-containing protein [Streptomyces sp. NBC_01766]
MHGSATPGWLLMALSAATGAYCLLRLRSSSPGARTAAGSEAVMGFGMAAMALPAAVAPPPAWGWAVFAVVFGGGALRALWLTRTGAHHLHHLIGSLAMVYMAVTMAPGSGGHGGHMEHAAGGIPLVTGVLLAYYAGYVLRTGAALVPVAAPVAAGGPDSGAHGGGAGGWGARPELALACRLSMGIAMFAMLLSL